MNPTMIIVSAMLASFLLILLPSEGEAVVALALGPNGGLPAIALVIPPLLGGLRAIGKVGALAALPLLAGLKLLAPLKLGLISKAGLVTGTIGTVLGGTALGLTAGKKRRRRSISAKETEVIFEDAEVVRMLVESDISQCAQRLICELANTPNRHNSDESSIVNFIRSASRSTLKQQPGFQPYENAYLLGQYGYDCKSIYNKCPYSAKQIMPLVSSLDNTYLQDYPQYVPQILKY